MLKINRLQIKIITDQGNYGFDEQFYEGLNFLASDDNTCGKSSIIEAIYYGLGFEEIIGGKGEKVLTSAYKTFIEDNDQKLSVIESKIYLEISNGLEVVTLYRTAKDLKRDSKLVTVYYSSLDKINDDNILIEDMYVHMKNSATNIKGFHAWAYTIALMQTSMEKKGNHPGVIIFDEPNQHSIIPEDMEEFFKSLLNLGNTTQTIVGITVKDTDTKSEIEKLPAELYHIIHITNKAFQRVN